MVESIVGFLGLFFLGTKLIEKRPLFDTQVIKIFHFLFRMTHYYLVERRKKEGNTEKRVKEGRNVTT